MVSVAVARFVRVFVIGYAIKFALFAALGEPPVILLTEADVGYFVGELFPKRI